MHCGCLVAVGAMLASLAANPAVAGDIRHDLIGCWDQQPSATAEAYLTRHPGAMSSVTLCFKRNGETEMSSTVGGETIGGRRTGLEGMSDTGRYAISNGRLLVYGMYAFDSYGPLSCLPAVSDRTELTLSDCISAFNLPRSRVAALRYRRTKG